jgi:hypothetical protein
VFWKTTAVMSVACGVFLLAPVAWLWSSLVRGTIPMSRAVALDGRHTRWSAAAMAGAPDETDVQQNEAELVALLGRYDGNDRATEAKILQLVGSLCAAPSSDAPVSDPRINGCWRLRFTSKSKFDISNPLGSRVDGTKPGLEGLFGSSAATEASSSPIQRAVTSSSYKQDSGVRIYQNIELESPDPRVDQLVFIGDSSEPFLRLSASAAKALPKRLDFTFDLAYFNVFGVRVPYPVPFRLLGKEAMGWLDTDYLSDNVRITQGNKGTTFVLIREV